MLSTQVNKEGRKGGRKDGSKEVSNSLFNVSTDLQNNDIVTDAIDRQ